MFQTEILSNRLCMENLMNFQKSSGPIVIWYIYWKKCRHLGLNGIEFSLCTSFFPPWTFFCCKKWVIFVSNTIFSQILHPVNCVIFGPHFFVVRTYRKLLSKNTAITYRSQLQIELRRLLSNNKPFFEFGHVPNRIGGIVLLFFVENPDTSVFPNVLLRMLKLKLLLC